MRPLTHHYTPFTVDRVQAIRMTREMTVAEAKTKLFEKTTTKKKGVSRKGKVNKVVLDAKSRDALASMDPATRAFLESQMK